MIKEKLKLIREGKLTAEKNITEFILKIRKENPEINAVLHINEDAISQAKEVEDQVLEILFKTLYLFHPPRCGILVPR